MSGATETYKVTSYANSREFLAAMMNAASHEEKITFDAKIIGDFVESLTEAGLMEESERNKTFTVSVREIYIGEQRRVVVVDEDGVPFTVRLPLTGNPVFNIFS